jgi:hypothetical protein
MKRGRKPDSGVLSGIKPDRETWHEIKNRFIYDSAEWRILRLRQLIGDGSQLADNYLSARRSERNARAAEIRYELRNNIEAIWRKHLTDEDRAVLDRFRSGDPREPNKRDKDALAKEHAARSAEQHANLKANRDIWEANAREEIGVTMQDLDRLWNRLRAKRKGKPPTREEWLAERDKLWIAKTGKPYEQAQPDEVTWLSRELVAQFERAVLDGDADWFRRQWQALGSRQSGGENTVQHPGRPSIGNGVLGHADRAKSPAKKARAAHGERNAHTSRAVHR